MPKQRLAADAYQAHGTHRASRQGDASAKFEEGLPEKPSWLDPAAAAIWNDIVGKLVDTRILTPSDSYSLALLATLYAQFSANPGDYPSARLAQLKSLLFEFGLSPGSRGRPQPAPKPTDPDDPWAQFGDRF